jgi:uncharacterized protein YpiB (UPF0302 family)
MVGVSIIPEDARRALKRLARQAKRREGELARELLVKAIRAAEREELLRRVEAAMTPELRQRLHDIAVALERLRGQARRGAAAQAPPRVRGSRHERELRRRPG